MRVESIFSSNAQQKKKKLFPKMLNFAFNYDFINNVCIQHETDNETQYYHEGQRGEEEADDQFDVWSVTHHQPQALTEGELGYLSPALYNSTWRRKQR